MSKTKVFVYGTLKKGFGANRILGSDAKFLGRAVTGKGYRLLDIGAFPALQNRGDSVVHGELYEVSSNQIIHLDRYEGVPSLYTKGTVTVTVDVDNKEHEANTYLWAKDSEHPVLDNGTWPKE